MGKSQIGYSPGKDAKMNKILFLCTDNVCSGRVAQELFNFYASGSRQGIRWLPGWVADSRGFNVDASHSKNNVVQPSHIQQPGNLSKNAIEYLRSEQIAFDKDRLPLPVEPSDLLWADRIIALFEPDHRPLVESRFPLWANRVEFWNVPEFHEANWGKALPRLEANVAELIAVIRAEEKVATI